MTPSTASKAFSVVMVFSVVMGLLAACGGDSPAATKCAGKHVYSGANLVSVAAGAPRGATFCIHQGTYSVSQAVMVQSGDRFVGVYQEPPARSSRPRSPSGSSTPRAPTGLSSAACG